MADNFPRALSDAEIRNAGPEAKPYKMFDGGGMFLLVKPSGSKLWQYKFRLNGKELLHSLGAYPEVSLSAARNAHRAARSLVASGVNPVHERQEAKTKAVQEEIKAKAGEFLEVVKLWREVTDPKLSKLTLKQRDREIKKHLAPAFRGRHIETITRVEIVDRLKRIERRTPEVARNLRGYLAGVFEHAANIGLVDANPVPPPRTMKPRCQVSHAAMSVDRLPGFLEAVDSSTATLETKTAMHLVILTACRRAEVAGARWDEIDLKAGEWLIPAERMKTRRPHWVPLSRQAIERLQELRNVSAGPTLFPNRHNPQEPMAQETLNALIKRIGYHGETVHGFRSVFSTHFNGLGANPDVIERCLSHTPFDMVRRVYNRHDYKEERRAMMQEWADWLDSLKNNKNEEDDNYKVLDGSEAA